MIWVLLIIVICIAVFYIVRFYCLKADLKKAAKDLKEIQENPEENRILLLSYPSKEAETLIREMNEYIRFSKTERIAYKNRERQLRAQIENISHDLRTPLTAIIGYLDLLEGEGLSAEDKSNLERAGKKAKTLQSLIGNFYDMSRLEMDDYRLKPERLDLARFTEETSLLFYQLFENRGLLVDFCIEESPLFIMADSAAMERIFNNMLQNALRYAESFLHISLCREEGKVCLSFENDTSVLSEKDIPHLFDRFYVQENSRTQQSSGLGLTINKLLTNAMGGNVEAALIQNVLRISYWFEEAEGNV